jgi:hypothetical protein
MPVIVLVLGRSELVGRSKRQESKSVKLKRGWNCHGCHAYKFKGVHCHGLSRCPLSGIAISMSVSNL